MNNFKSSWRPAAGWVCVAGLFYDFLFYHLFSGILGAHGFLILPPTDSSKLADIISLLGIGGLRTYEKSKGLTEQ